MRDLFQQSWAFIRQHPILLLPGALATATGSALDGGLTELVLNGIDLWHLLFRSAGQSTLPGGMPLPDLNTIPSESIPANEQGGSAILFALGVLIALLCVGFLLALLAMVIGRVSAGVVIGQGLDEGASFRILLNRAWARSWRLIVLLSIPAIPITLGLILSIAVLGGLLLALGYQGDVPGIITFLSETTMVHLGLIGFNVPFIVFTIFLFWLRLPADRLLLRDNLKAIAALRASWRLIRPHLREAATLMLLQVSVGALLALIPWGFERLVFWLPILVGLPMWGLKVGFVTIFLLMWTFAFQSWDANQASVSIEKGNQAV